MRRHLKGIDHCCVLVNDFGRAHDAFTRMGFTLSPFGRHGADMGTGNYTVMLEGDYVELIGIIEPTAFNQELRHVLSFREGIAAIALSTDDVVAASVEVRSAGIEARKPHHVRRPVDLPGGEKAEASFMIAEFPDVKAPYCQFFCSQAHTPEHTWVPSLMKHANTAWGIEHLAVTTPDPEGLASDNARLFDSTPSKNGEGEVTVATGGTPILYTTRAALARRYAGADTSAVAAEGPAVLAVKVRDAKTAADCLRQGRVTFEETAAGLVVPPQEACGVLLVLRESA
ncbi:VOC family protein [Streptomyces sp. NPDC026672]|uniref:VOC family protein n=1 Tax=unclassified Streptomyces TaxID=2593676 RepID=UPI0033E42459